jgi:hypothetical protein
MLAVLCILWLALSAFDAYATIRLLNKFGIEAEMNPMIRKLCGFWGLTKGVIAGIFTPTVIIAAGLVAFHWTMFAAVLVGMRTMLALLQVHSLRAN